MSESISPCEPWAVLNPGGKDPNQDFPDFAGAPSAALHPPVNYHAYAASTGGAFLRNVAAVRERGLKHVILLLRSDLQDSLAALEKLQSLGCRVFLSFKESGLHQISQTLLRPGNPRWLGALCEKADGALSSTPDLVAIYRSFGARNVVFLPTPYPVDDGRWDFSLPEPERRGIFVGTREFDVPTRNHALALTLALSLAVEFSQPVSVVNEDGRAGRKRIESIRAPFPQVELAIIAGRKAYPEYLRQMARHRLVWQCDASAVPGQVAGDALLCRIPCIGGNGTIERLAFPELTSHGRTFEEITAAARKFLADPDLYRAECAAAQALAAERLSFAAVRRPLSVLSAPRRT